MVLGKVLCKWFGHSWEDSPHAWNLRKCKRGPAGQYTYYHKAHGLFREDAHPSNYHDN